MNSDIQNQIDQTWDSQWDDGQSRDLKLIFRQRLFIEGFPRVKRMFKFSDRKILEVGCGTGRYSVALAKEFPEATVYCTDILDSSLVLAEKLKKYRGADNVIIKKEDLFKTSFPDNYFDVVFSDGVIEHFDPKSGQGWGEALQEMARIVKPGGRVIFNVPNFLNFPHTIYKAIMKFPGRKDAYQYGYEKSFLVKDFKKAMPHHGLKLIAHDGFYPGYGLYRLKTIHGSFKFLGRALNRLCKIIDTFTNRLASKTFGFMILISAEKK